MTQWNVAQIQAVREADSRLSEQIEEAAADARDVSAAQSATAAAQREMLEGDWAQAQQVLEQANVALASAPPVPAVRVEPVAQRDEPVRSDSRSWARELFAVGEYDEAQIVFDRAVRENPNDEDAWFGLGHAAFAAGNYEEASNAIREGLNLDPGRPRDQISREDLYGNPADRNSQLGNVDNYLRRSGADPAALFTFGYHLYHDGRTRAAEEILRQIPAGAAEYNAAQLYLDSIAADE